MPTTATPRVTCNGQTKDVVCLLFSSFLKQHFTRKYFSEIKTQIQIKTRPQIGNYRLHYLESFWNALLGLERSPIDLKAKNLHISDSQEMIELKREREREREIVKD